MNHWVNKASHAADITLRDAMNRTRGLMAEMHTHETEDVSNTVLAERVRSQMGNAVGPPSSIEVTAATRRITLSGPILAHEVEGLIERVSSIPDVKSVENRLEVYQEPGNVPGLQGQPARRRGGHRFELLQRNWSPTARFLMAAVGGLLAAYGARQRGAMGSAMGASGLTLLVRAASNEELKCLVGMGNRKDGPTSNIER